MTTFTIEEDQRQTIIGQIPRMTLFAISGGRVVRLDDGIRLPVGNGYKVDIHLTPADDYTVERVFVRNGVTTSHGAEDTVYCDDLGETAYRASCFRNDDAEYWPAALTV
jgi:lysine/ornithine N-monooxygenase